MIAKSALTLALLLIFGTVSLPALAQDPTEPINKPPPPPNSDGPTRVKVGLYISQITGIDQINEEFTIEGFMEWQWLDERLAFDAEEVGSDREVYFDEGVEHLLRRNAIWWPGLEITNGRGSRDIQERSVIIMADGQVTYIEHFNSTIQADFDLRKFPFDDQQFHIRLESLVYDNSIVQLEADVETTGFGDNLGEEEWELSTISSREEAVQPRLSNDTRMSSELAFSLNLYRHPLYYFYRILLPAFLIVTVLSASFLLGDYSLQLEIATIGGMTLIALQFTIADSLPHLAFLTLLDAMLVISFMFVAATIVSNFLMMRLARTGQESLAKRINRIAVVMFPTAYFSAMAIIWMIY